MSRRMAGPAGWLLAGAVLLLAAGWTHTARASETVVYYHTDALRSVSVVTNAQGQVIERTYYAPYGQVLNRPLRDGPGYTGHREDAETGLVYMQQRYYDPETGRFLSPDPVPADGNGGNFNRYWYANDNPYRYTDLDGRQADCTGSHIGGQACGSLNLKVTQVSPPSPVSQLNVLGHNVAVHYSSTVQQPDREASSEKLSAAADLLNTNAGKFSDADKKAVTSTDAVRVISRGLMGDTANRSITLTAAYLSRSSAAWVGSLFAHEGQHYLNVGQFHGNNLWMDEYLASRVQLSVGRKIGFTNTEIESLELWMGDPNRMQKHMENGYNGN